MRGLVRVHEEGFERGKVDSSNLSIEKLNVSVVIGYPLDRLTCIADSKLPAAA